MTVDHHDHDRIVERTQVPSRFEADLLVAKLHSNGIMATARYNDAGGWAPQFGRISGSGVMVFESDLADAAAVIGDDAPPAP